MFHLKVLAEKIPLTSIFQNMTFIAYMYVQSLANVTKIAKFNLPSIFFVAERSNISIHNDQRCKWDFY